MAATYQQVVAANLALGAWALTEASGLAFAPYIGGSDLVGSGAFTYQQAGPIPAGFSLGVAAGAKLTLTYLTVVNPPFTRSGWFKLASATPASELKLIYAGNAGANGAGVTVNTNGHMRLLLGAVSATDTGIIWPDTNWHLVHRAANQDGQTNTIAIDGVVRWRGSGGVANAPSPNVEVWGADSSTGASVAFSLAWPAVYAYEMSPGQMASDFVGSTNPNAALSGTLSGGGQTQASILDYVAKIFQNAP